MKKKYRIAYTLRFFTFIFIIVLILTMLVMGLLKQYNANAESVHKTITYEIHADDTLWKLADKYADGLDKRIFIEKICKINNIDANNLKDGDLIEIPIL